MRFIELFCGIGGFRLGLDKIGWKCVFSNDLNPKACSVYRSAFGNVVEQDIRSVRTEQIPDFDVLTAGFPCQSFSSAGTGRGFEDERGNVFFDIIRIMKAKRPRAFILENVKNLLFHDDGKTLKVVVSELSKLGYLVDLALLDSKHFGVPQSRERTYLIGVDEDPRPIFAQCLPKDAVTRTACKGLPLCSLFPCFDKKRTTLSSLSPKQKIQVLLLLEEKIRQKIRSRPRSLIRVRDVRTGFQSIPTWTFDLFGPTTPEERVLLEEIRKKFQGVVFGNMAIPKDRPKANVPKFKASTFSQEDIKRLDGLATMGYVRKYEDSYTLINRNILPHGLPSVYGGPKAIGPTLTASNMHKFAIVLDDGFYVLGPDEFESMQGFPKGHTDVGLDEKERCRLLGNAVVPCVVEYVGATVERLVRGSF